MLTVASNFLFPSNQKMGSTFRLKIRFTKYLGCNNYHAKTWGTDIDNIAVSLNIKAYMKISIKY